MWVGIYLVGYVFAWIAMYTDAKYAWVNGEEYDECDIISIGECCQLSVFSWLIVLSAIINVLIHQWGHGYIKKIRSWRPNIVKRIKAFFDKPIVIKRDVK